MPNSAHFIEEPDLRHQRRLTWALRGIEHTLRKALERDTSERAVRLRESAFTQPASALGQMIMVEADPTDNKRFTAWLVREYAQGRLILEDLGTANETLALFQRYAPRLKPEQRDIQRYGSLAAVWEAVRGFADRAEAQSNRAQRAFDRARAYAESRILRQDPDGFTVAVPMTEFAAKWWGRGTRWCTAAEKNNQFWYYHNQAPLLVILIPNVGKLQFWASDGDYQFKDAADRDVDYLFVVEHWEALQAILPFFLGHAPLLLGSIPFHARTAALCEIAVSHDGRALREVPKMLRSSSAALCEIAVSHNGRALREVPKMLRSSRICHIAVAQDGNCLPSVPELHRTAELYLTAVTQNGVVLGLIPEHLRTEELCLIAVTQNGYALEYVPRHLRTKKLCRIAVGQYGFALGSVPEPIIDEEICRTAVAQSGGALSRVPEEMRTKDVCRIAVAQSWGALDHVPEALKSLELCLLALEQCGLAFEYLPEHLRTAELCRTAVARSSRVIEQIPTPLLTDDICRVAVAQDGMALAYVPENRRNEEICFIAVAQNFDALRFVPTSLITTIEKRITPPTPAPLTPQWRIGLLDQMEQAFRVCAPSNSDIRLAV